MSTPRKVTDDPFATGDTGPDTHPNTIDTPGGDTPDTPVIGGTPLVPDDSDRDNDFDAAETRARFLEHGDRADILALLDHATGNR